MNILNRYQNHLAQNKVNYSTKIDTFILNSRILKKTCSNSPKFYTFMSRPLLHPLCPDFSAEKSGKPWKNQENKTIIRDKS
jgi:hypothetical protein